MSDNERLQSVFVRFPDATGIYLSNLQVGDLIAHLYDPDLPNYIASTWSITPDQVALVIQKIERLLDKASKPFA